VILLNILDSRHEDQQIGLNRSEEIPDFKIKAGQKIYPKGNFWKGKVKIARL